MINALLNVLKIAAGLFLAMIAWKVWHMPPPPAMEDRLTCVVMSEGVTYQSPWLRVTDGIGWYLNDSKGYASRGLNEALHKLGPTETCVVNTRKVQ